MFVILKVSAFFLKVPYQEFYLERTVLLLTAAKHTFYSNGELHFENFLKMICLKWVYLQRLRLKLNIFP